MTKETGFLLSYLKYGDDHAVLHCFTKESGFRTFFSKAIYSSKSRKKAYLLPLNQLVFTLSARQSNAIPNLTKLEPVQAFEFYGDVKSSSVIFFVAEFLHQILRNENQQALVYSEIETFLKQLEAKNYQAHIGFLFRMLHIHGLTPFLAEHTYLNPESGNFVTEPVHPLYDKFISETWKRFISSQESYSVVVEKSQRKDLLASLLRYYQHHFPNFKPPKSLEILTQIFE